MKIIVTSVPGGGKTTALNFLKKRIKNVKIVNAGDLFFELSKKYYGIKERDEIRKKLSIEQQRKLQEKVTKKILKIKSKLLIIDTHLSIKTKEGYFPAQSEKILHKLKPDLIIILEYRPQDILKRRKKDLKRKREMESLKEIEEHQKINREFGISSSQHASCPLYIIDLKFKEKKRFEHAKKAASEMEKLIKSLKK